MNNKVKKAYFLKAILTTKQKISERIFHVSLPLQTSKYWNDEFKHIIRNGWRMANCHYRAGYTTTFWRQKIPELMRGLGRGVKEFKDGIGGEEEEEKKTKSEKEIK